MCLSLTLMLTIADIAVESGKLTTGQCEMERKIEEHKTKKAAKAD